MRILLEIHKHILAMALLCALLMAPYGETAAQSLQREVNLIAADVDLLLGSSEVLEERVEKQSKALEEIRTQLTTVSTIEELEALKAAVEAIKEKMTKDIRGFKKANTRRKEEIGALSDRVTALESEKLSPGQINKHLRAFGSMRVRGETFGNHLDLDSDKDDSESLYTHRLRFGFEVKPTDYASMTLEAQDARIFGEDGYSGNDDEGLGVHRGFLSVRLPLPEKFALEIEGGRLGLSYGNGFLVGEDDWSFTGRAFDGVRASFAMDGENAKPVFDADLFYSVIRERRTPSGEDAELLGFVLGSRAVEKWVHPQVQIYYLNDGVESEARRNFTTIALRLEGKPLDFIYYELDAAFQMGKVGFEETEKTRLATAYHFHGAYMPPAAIKPELHVSFYTSSGDGNPSDDRDVNFDPMFQDSFSHLDPMNLLALSNLTLGGLSASARPLPPLRIDVGFYSAYLSSKQGGPAAFGSQKYPVSELAGTIGHELFLSGTYNRDDVIEFKLGYATFFPGDAAKESTGGDSPAHWLLAQGLVKF